MSGMRFGGPAAQTAAVRYYRERLASDDPQVWARTTGLLLGGDARIPRKLVELAEARAQKELATPTKRDADDVWLDALHKQLAERDARRRDAARRREVLDR